VALSIEQAAEVEAIAKAAPRSLHDRLGLFLRSWGPWQMLLSMAVMIASLVKVVYSERKWTAFYLCMAAIGATALFQSFYRDYWGALGI
jgi:hypothetical protein